MSRRPSTIRQTVIEFVSLVAFALATVAVCVANGKL